MCQKPGTWSEQRCGPCRHRNSPFNCLQRKEKALPKAKGTQTVSLEPLSLAGLRGRQPNLSPPLSAPAESKGDKPFLPLTGTLVTEEQSGATSQGELDPQVSCRPSPNLWHFSAKIWAPPCDFSLPLSPKGW